jgi:SAM-dependent methyltransferase
LAFAGPPEAGVAEIAKRTRCRSCFSPGLRPVVDFGLQPLAGFYSPTPEGALHPKRYPLVLEACPVCDLFQITDLPPIAEVFHEDYTYSSSQVPPLVAHFADYARWLVDRLPPDGSVLEFGCNDGVLLQELRALGCRRLVGVDASPNMVATATARGFDVVQGFFGNSLTASLAMRGPFDLITSSNVFAHIDDLRDVLSAAHDLLVDGGYLCIEVHDAEKLILEGQFDTVYHEHLTYFSENSLQTCLNLNGFSIEEVEKTPMHGGGLRTRARKMPKDSTPSHPVARSAQEIETIGTFMRGRIAACRAEILKLRTDHGPLDGYGMAGRAQMFLAMTGTEAAFGALYDDAPIRQSRYAVGTDLRISPFAPDEAADACVILAWNYAPAILARIEAYYSSISVMFPEILKLK